MASSTTKKVVVRRFEREPLSGYANPASYQQLSGVELLSAQGDILMVPYAEIKTLSFVRDFETAPDPGRRLFHARPKIEGLWVNFVFLDGEVLEGVLPNNLLPLEHFGFTIVPPEPYGNHQRVFIPRAALRSVEVLGVIGSPLQKRKRKPAAQEQIGLFDEQ